MAVDHESIKNILDGKGQNADTSLRAKSLQRARSQQVPRTLTAHEWERWYAEHGVPESHKKQENTTKKPWWQFWSS
ncbi:MAG: hypothetical protein ACI9B9_000500 [Halioglobus sp.]|jgi:hypothetical protein